jgi:subtilase family serine protease
MDRTLLRGCLAAATMCLLIALGAIAPAAAGAAPSAVALAGSASPGRLYAIPLHATSASAKIEFDVGLRPRDEAGALALVAAVSDPSSSQYRHFLTPAQWERRFSPSPASVSAVSAWLRSNGISIEAVTADRMTVQASAPAATVERAFGTHLGEYASRGRKLRLASGPLSVPSTIGPLISGVAGIDETLARADWRTDATRVGRVRRAPSAAGESEHAAPAAIPPPPGFRNAPPCSSYWEEKHDKTDPTYGGGYPRPLPYALCGYVPAQLQSAYGLSPAIGAGDNGHGVTVAIVDAFASPTLLADAQEYTARHQAEAPLQAGQFTELLSKSFNDEELCEANEWSVEQGLDVEAVHAMAPGAKILYAGAKNCERGLDRSVQQIVDGHLAQVISDSWGMDGGDLTEPPSARREFDNVLAMAAATGIGVQFSSGDEGDEFTLFGVNVGGYPETSPYATSVGGTSLEISKRGARVGEPGWSTSKSTLCTAVVEEHELAEEEAFEEEGEGPLCTKPLFGSWLPPAPGAWLYGSGGATSYVYPEPSYQQGVVPLALAKRNRQFTGIANRVEPDISMDADPTTGMLFGLTQEFPEGVQYGEYRIGGTSLASPLLAGVMADADQAAGGALGFMNPLIYELARRSKAGSQVFYDVVPEAKRAAVRVDYADGTDEEEGLLNSVRTFTYEGPENFCFAEEELEEQECTQNVSLTTARGFDSMTGIGVPGSGFIRALGAASK